MIQNTSVTELQLSSTYVLRSNSPQPHSSSLYNLTASLQTQDAEGRVENHSLYQLIRYQQTRRFKPATLRWILSLITVHLW